MNNTYWRCVGHVQLSSLYRADPGFSIGGGAKNYVRAAHRDIPSANREGHAPVAPPLDPTLIIIIVRKI